MRARAARWAHYREVLGDRFGRLAAYYRTLHECRRCGTMTGSRKGQGLVCGPCLIGKPTSFWTGQEVLVVGGVAAGKSTIAKILS